MCEYWYRYCVCDLGGGQLLWPVPHYRYRYMYWYQWTWALDLIPLYLRFDQREGVYQI